MLRNNCIGEGRDDRNTAGSEDLSVASVRRDEAEGGRSEAAEKRGDGAQELARRQGRTHPATQRFHHSAEQRVGPLQETGR